MLPSFHFVAGDERDDRAGRVSTDAPRRVRSASEEEIDRGASAYVSSLNRESKAVGRCVFGLRRSALAALAAVAILFVLAAAPAAHASLPPRNAPECDGLRADAPCINGADNKKGVCTHGPVDSAGRAALFCKVDGKVDGKVDSKVATSAPSASAPDKASARSGCSVAHGVANRAWSDVLLGAFLCLAITVFVTRRFRRH